MGSGAIITLLIVAFIIFAIFGLPIGIAVGISSVIALLVQGDIPLMVVPQRMYYAINSFTLMGIPFFMLVGSIMERSGITTRLVNFANAIVGSLKGGMTYVSVMAGMLMGGISGSAPADTAALSSVMIPSMERLGYKKPFAAAIQAAAGSIGIIIPPSMPMIVLGSITGISVGKLFMGGLIPGIIIGLSYMVVCWILCTKFGYDENVKVKFTFGNLTKATKEAILPILAPVIIIGGILTGVFTPTESAIAAVAYTLFLALVVYRTISLKELPQIFMDSIISSANVMLIIATSSLFAWLLTMNNFSTAVVQLFGGLIDNQILIMLIINLIFFIGGMFLEGTALQIMFVPVLYPLAMAAGVSPVAFGVTVIVNISLGTMTPPVGVCLFVAAASGGVSFDKVAKEAVPFIIALLLNIVLLILVPGLITYLPSLMK